MNIGWKLMTMGVSALGGVAAKRVTELIWDKGLGQSVPKGDDSDLELGVAQIAAFAAVSALISAGLTAVIEQKAAGFYGKK
ncbi:MAG: DUF4235 domain-containing protein [Trueperella sp.]|nr:DUF4235 domain-containing protein [Trueperella sp.]